MGARIEKKYEEKRRGRSVVKKGRKRTEERILNGAKRLGWGS
jgi:hypothetical protein